MGYLHKSLYLIYKSHSISSLCYLSFPQFNKECAHLCLYHGLPHCALPPSCVWATIPSHDPTLHGNRDTSVWHVHQWPPERVSVCLYVISTWVDCVADLYFMIYEGLWTTAACSRSAACISSQMGALLWIQSEESGFASSHVEWEMDTVLPTSSIWRIWKYAILMDFFITVM